MASVGEEELLVEDSNMEIKRKFEKLTVSKRRFVIREAASEKTTCTECREPMLPCSQAAVLLGIKQSRIFQIVQTGAAHSAEAEAGSLMICLNSFAAVLEADEKK